MRTLNMMIWILMVASFARPVWAQPAYTLDQREGVGVLSITGAEITIIAGEGAELIEGLAIPAVGNRVRYAIGGEHAWRLAPGVYAVTSYAPAVGNAARIPTEWTVAVEPPTEPDRIHRIADTLARWISVANDWAALAPSPEEVRDALLLTFR